MKLKCPSLILFLLAFTKTITCNGQSISFQYPVYLSNTIYTKVLSFPVIDSTSHALFLFDKKSITGLQLNNDFTQKSTSITKKSKNDFFLGYFPHEKTGTLFFRDLKKNTVKAVIYDWEKGDANSISLPIQFKKEVVLESFTYEDTFIITTVSKYSSLLNFYIIDQLNHYTKQTLDFSNLKLKDGYAELSLYDQLVWNGGAYIQKIEQGKEYPLLMTSVRNKFYPLEDKLIITMDNYENQTNMLIIDLKYFSGKFKQFDHSHNTPTQYKLIRSNSLICNDYLLQLRVTQEMLNLTFWDLKTDQMVKSYKGDRSNNIGFRNTPLFQNGGTTVFSKDQLNAELDLYTFLNKVAGSDQGLSASFSDGQMEITVGGVLTASESHLGIAPYAAGFSTTFPALTLLGFADLLTGFDRSTYFKTRMSIPDFEHQPGKLDQKKMDHISNAVKKLGPDREAETFYRLNDKIVYGFYNRKTHNYYLMNFSH